MDSKELNKVLKGRAIELGLCEKWQSEWDKEETKQELIEKYLKGIDFCISHDYPKLEFIKAYFPKNLLFQNGIFVDDKVDAINIKTAVLLGESSGKVRYEGLRAGSVYVRHSSVLRIEAVEGARVFVEIYDDCIVTVTADEHSKVFIYQHGGHVKSDGNVIIRDKTKGGQ